MVKKEIIFRSAREDTACWGVLWLPENSGKIKAVIQIVHGMCEYIERYEHTAEWFCERGYAVCGHDLLGHKNTAKRNNQQLGHFGGLSYENILVSDIENFRKEAKNHLPDVPWFLLGHSMGSFLARLYVVKYHQNINGFIMSGTSKGGTPISYAKFLSISIARSRGEDFVSDKVYKLASASFLAKIQNPTTTSDWVCSVPEVAKNHSTDEYCNFTFSVSSYNTLFNMLTRVNTPKWYTLFPKNLSTYIFSGMEDPVGAYGVGPQYIYDKLSDEGVESVELKLYPNARHEMLNEYNKQEVHADIESWLQKTMEKSTLICPSVNKQTNTIKH